MQQPVTIVLLGKPVPGTRAQSKYRWLPKNQQHAMDQLRLAASDMMQGREILTGALKLSMVAEMPVPTSWSNKKRLDALLCHIYPATTPDLKNILWLVEDALKSVVYADDKQIVRYELVEKRYSGQPKIVVTISCV